MGKTIENINERIKSIYQDFMNEETGGFITGDGPVPSDVLFLGEAPGKNEVELGKPFVGMAGKTLDEYLKLAGLERANVRITNSCFLRPIKTKILKDNKKSISNRTPKTPELKIFKEVLEDEIALVNPKLIVTLGNIPLKRVTKFNCIGECHGVLYFNDDIKRYIFPMYHPSSLTYNRKEEFKKTYIEDWLKLKTLLCSDAL